MIVAHARTDQGYTVTFAVQQSNGSLRTGLAAGDFTVTVVNPADSANNVPTVAELSQKAGMYRFVIPSAFFTTHGIGTYRYCLEIDTVAGPSGAPNVKAVESGLIEVTKEDLDTLADGGAADYVRTTDSLHDVRAKLDADLDVAVSTRATQAQILSDATPFPGANIDAAISSRASQASVDTIQNVTRVAISIPKLVIPDSGGPILYKFYLNLFDTAGNPEDPDSDQIDVTAENQSGASRTANLGGVPTGRMTKLTTGRYEITYSVATTHAIEQLIFRFTYVENGVSFTQDRTQDAVSNLEDNFTAADRTMLTAIQGTTTSIQSDTDDIQVRLPATLNGGRMRSHAEAMDAGVIGAAQIASGAVDADALAADAVVEIQAAILSDATPFPGGNIDAAVTSRASQTSVNDLIRAAIVATTTAAAGSSTTEVRTGLAQPDNFFNGEFVLVVNAVGVAVRRISEHTNLNGALLLDEALPFTPAASDPVLIIAQHVSAAGGIQ